MLSTINLRMRSVWVYMSCLPCVTKLMELTELNSTSAGQSHFFAASQLKAIESTLLGILLDLSEYTNAIQFFSSKRGEREPVDKDLWPLFRPLVIILPIICQ